jgi:hypothetical protein
VCHHVLARSRAFPFLRLRCGHLGISNRYLTCTEGPWWARFAPLRVRFGLMVLCTAVLVSATDGGHPAWGSARSRRGQARMSDDGRWRGVSELRHSWPSELSKGSRPSKTHAGAAESLARRLSRLPPRVRSPVPPRVRPQPASRSPRSIGLNGVKTRQPIRAGTCGTPTLRVHLWGWTSTVDVTVTICHGYCYG